MAKDTFFSSKSTLNLNGNILSLEVPKVMGIINTTPDSFYESSRINDEKTILKSIEKMIADGADIIDIGGYSSRPGAINIDPSEEIRRTAPIIEKVKKEFPNLVLSIDTFRSEVAKEAVNAGADIINDISGGEMDANMFEMVARLDVPYILMHMKGTPQNMATETSYKDLLLDITQYFQSKVIALNKLGIVDIVIDPGFGFAKSIDQNYDLLKNLDYFKILGLPLLVGISRKSMIYKALNVTTKEALNGTTALHMIALQKGARILRVHDVKEAVEAVKLFNLTFK